MSSGYSTPSNGIWTHFHAASTQVLGYSWRNQGMNSVTHRDAARQEIGYSLWNTTAWTHYDKGQRVVGYSMRDTGGSWIHYDTGWNQIGYSYMPPGGTSAWDHNIHIPQYAADTRFWAAHL